MKKIAAIMTATTLVAGSVFAGVVNYSTSFTTADSFADGQLNGQNTWAAHTGFSVSDAAGAGLVNSVNANGPTHGASSADVTSELAAGKTITLTLNANFVGTYANQNNGAWQLGITDSAAFKDGTAFSVGSATFNNNGADNFFLSPIQFLNADKYDTGVAWDSAYRTVTTTITKSATANTFDVTAQLDSGVPTAFTMTNAGLWDGTSTAYAGFRFRGANSGNVDSFSVSTIPEPATLGLVGVFGGAMLFIRRKFMI